MEKLLENHGRVLIEETDWKIYWFYFYIDKLPVRRGEVNNADFLTWLSQGYIERLPSYLPTRFCRITNKGVHHVQTTNNKSITT